MKLHELAPAAGSTRERFRVGRGHGSGNGKTAGKGHKGQNARAGGGVRPGFEGGQLPLYRRLPQRGFKRPFATHSARLSVSGLNTLEDVAVVDAAALTAAGLVNDQLDGIKILGNGELTKKLTVHATAFSESAKAKIEAAGGKAEVM